MGPFSQTRVIVLLSGGVDSCVVLAQALSMGRACTAISFDYGQRHRIELNSAEAIARHYRVPRLLLRIDPNLFAQNSSSALVQHHIPITTVPSTYVPCRNLLFLAHAASFAESLKASELWVGAHSDDVPAYPDCSQSFFRAFEAAAAAGSHLDGITVVSPLVHLTKKAVVALGKELKAPLELTWSCYDPQNGRPCAVCPACLLRAAAT